jgi:hypothetical protein
MGKVALPVILACFLASVLFAQESQLVVINEFGQGIGGQWGVGGASCDRHRALFHRGFAQIGSSGS